MTLRSRPIEARNSGPAEGCHEPGSEQSAHPGTVFRSHLAQDICDVFERSHVIIRRRVIWALINEPNGVTQGLGEEFRNRTTRHEETLAEWNPRGRTNIGMIARIAARPEITGLVCSSQRGCLRS